MKKDITRRLDKWEKKFSKLGYAKDDFDRLIRHFYGVTIYRGESVFIRFIRNVSSICILPVIAYRLERNACSSKVKPADAILMAPDKAFLMQIEDLPYELKERYKTYHQIFFEKNSLLKDYKNNSIDETAIELVVKCVKKFPFQPYMILYLILQLSRISTIIHQFSPKAIITTQAEQSFASSIVTLYCELLGVEYICIQHGDYSYNPSMAFMRFSEYYAWNKETIEILELVNNKITFAKIYTPSKLIPKYTRKNSPDYFITYYLSDETEENIIKIKNLLEMFVEKGYSCNVRRHPRAQREDSIKKIFLDSKVDVENTSNISIGDSLSNTEYIVSYRSTVLSEGIANSMNVVLDDVVGDIEILKRLHDINYKRITLKLSDLVRKCL